MTARARVLVADDEPGFRRVVADHLRDLGYDVAEAADGAEAIRSADSAVFDLILLDVRMPAVGGFEVLERVRAAPAPPEVVVVTAHATVEDAVRAVKRGACDYLMKPIGLAELEAVAERAIERARMGRREAGRAVAGVRETRAHLIGASDAMRLLREAIRRAAASEEPVLVLGKTGTGKELVARAIHAAAACAGGAFVAVNCGGLSANLIENELFGHERGAFTGAAETKRGLVEIASEGTLFLDEAGDLPLEAQAKVLRMIETGAFRRMGGTREISSNARIIAATNRDISADVVAGRFREDLYWRLAVITVDVPSLRARPDDIAALCDHFARGRVRFSAAAVEFLRGHSWPGNVRELRALVERASLLNRPEIGAAEAAALLAAPIAKSPERLDDLEESHIRRVLADCGGNKSEAARRLGISRMQIYRVLTYAAFSKKNS